jgi:hypothetical protein
VLATLLVREEAAVVVLLAPQHTLGVLVVVCWSMVQQPPVGPLGPYLVAPVAMAPTTSTSTHFLEE